MAIVPAENPPDVVTWTDIVRFTRQLSHDIRNSLNAAELQSAYLAELAGEPEMKNEIQRLREMIAEIGTNLQRLSAGFSEVNPSFISYPAADFMEDLKQKIAKDFGDDAAKVTWEIQLGDANLNIDPQLMQQAFVELFTNAFQHERSVSTLTVRACVEDSLLAFTLREPKARFEHSTEDWGRAPLHSVSQGHYGLGLNRVRLIVEAHGGEFGAQYDRAESVLLTTIKLPLSGQEGAK